MNVNVAVDLVQNALWKTVLVSAPILVLTLVAGLVVSIFQAVTQIHESTLSFVPKILAVMAAMFLFGHWMLRIMSDFTADLLIRFPDLVR